MNKLYSAAIGVLAITLIASAAQADGPDTSAQGLLSAWKGKDPGMRMVAEVIASAFVSDLSWKGTLGGKEVYCPPQGLKGGQVMTTLEPVSCEQFRLGRKVLWPKREGLPRERRRIWNCGDVADDRLRDDRDGLDGGVWDRVGIRPHPPASHHVADSAASIEK
jgi:hypothetical protein